MSALIRHVSHLRDLFAGAAEAADRLKAFDARNPAGRQDEIGAVYQAQKLLWERKIAEYLEQKLLRYPPFHERHADKLEAFHEKGDYDKSVFIMTKFPDPALATSLDQQLQAVIEVTKKSIEDCGFVPRLAGRTYHAWLWDNVELHLLGCRRGIAIVEDRYRPELNPNVALEWGWMKGMGREVLYLMEERFRNVRADWQGLISETFQWGSPNTHIPAAVLGFLKP